MVPLSSAHSHSLKGAPCRFYTCSYIQVYKLYGVMVVMGWDVPRSGHYNILVTEISSEVQKRLKTSPLTPVRLKHVCKITLTA